MSAANGIIWLGLGQPATVYPAIGDVEAGVAYGDGGSEFTGTFAVPTEAQVEAGVGFGAAGTEFTGTFAGGSCDYPAAGDVEAGVSYASGTRTGTFAKPAVGDVEAGVGYGAAGTEFTGTFVVPGTANVRSGVGYGAGGTEFGGTYVGSTGTGSSGLPSTGKVSSWWNATRTASRIEDVESEIADDPTSIVIMRGATDLAAQSVRLLIPSASGAELASAGGEEARADLIVLGTSTLDIQRGDRFLVGTQLYEVIYVAPEQPSSGERKEAGARQVQ